MKLDFTECIGLRYLDTVLPKDDESLANHLEPEVLGLSQKLTGDLAFLLSETLTSTPVGQLISRVLIQDGRVGLPLELVGSAPRVRPRFTRIDGRHAVVATDAFYEKRETFSLNRLASRLSALHDEVLKSFEAAVTPYALQSWA
ncbi:TIGR04255 family protein [Gloeobacter morelensis]|uniref:TIGR04255 family protein n=1 Tax=Gloeobacter morelensis MG652769 TaxID=2781736 RepID=A0ABY3PHF0_9CYAN|nr:TIGR04255 family protein [Gloeobacter morelensis]UFP93106.1 TIGR04255 family protein [Gloeobacter morelensis MG652769]